MGRRKSLYDVKAVKKLGILSEDYFLQKLSEQCNYVDKESLKKDFYSGFVRMVTKELREKGVCRLPHLGDMILIKGVPRSGFVGRDKEGRPMRTIISSKYTLKFQAFDSWRQYFAKLKDALGRPMKLDPRERLLNRDLDNLN